MHPLHPSKAGAALYKGSPKKLAKLAKINVIFFDQINFFFQLNKNQDVKNVTLILANIKTTLPIRNIIVQLLQGQLAVYLM